MCVQVEEVLQEQAAGRRGEWSGHGALLGSGQGGCPPLPSPRSPPLLPPATPLLLCSPSTRPPPAVNLRQQTLDAATRNIGSLKREIERVKQTDAGRLRQEYQRLVQVSGRVRV